MTTRLSLDPGQPEQDCLALGDSLFQEHGVFRTTPAFTDSGVLVPSAAPLAAYEKLT
ncbi:hypothetical protein [Streptomyces sp. NPDC056544]|uniref:hypothetical protein n=1 Tax=unclassified Streptomyces TaxID=2593676 RepID=UPI0036A7A285